MSRVEVHQEPGTPSEELPKWDDTHMVHIVGSHLRMNNMLSIFTDCGAQIAQIQDREGWYPGNTEKAVTCFMCLAKSNFGTYAPR